MFAQVCLLVGHLFLHTHYIGTLGKQHLHCCLLAVDPTVSAVLLILSRRTEVI